MGAYHVIRLEPIKGRTACIFICMHTYYVCMHASKLCMHAYDACIQPSEMPSRPRNSNCFCDPAARYVSTNEVLEVPLRPFPYVCKHAYYACMHTLHACVHACMLCNSGGSGN